MQGYKMKHKIRKRRFDPQKMLPPKLTEELLRLGRMEPPWLEWRDSLLGDGSYSCRPRVDTWIQPAMKRGGEGFAMLAVSRWLAQGPKVFYPTKEQAEAFENIEVNLLLSEYSQPYEAILVAVDFPPFDCVICHKGPVVLTCSIQSLDNTQDIVTTVQSDRNPLEVSINRFDPDCSEEDSKQAVRALRVALNSCLALTHFGHRDKVFDRVAFDKDRKLVESNKHSDEAKDRARTRMKLAVREVSFRQYVKVRQTDNRPANPTKQEPRYNVKPHWRKGHWAMQAYGKGRTLRKRILRPPVFVRADLFEGDLANTSVEYVG